MSLVRICNDFYLELLLKPSPLTQTVTAIVSSPLHLPVYGCHLAMLMWIDVTQPNALCCLTAE